MLAKKKRDCADNAAYALVCKMFDWGFVESEPEGLELEVKISELIQKHFGVKNPKSYLRERKFSN